MEDAVILQLSIREAEDLEALLLPPYEGDHPPTEPLINVLNKLSRQLDDLEDS